MRTPSDDGADPSEPPAEGALEPVRGRVLLIDDERAVALVYGELLSMHHEVVIAGGGQQALDLLSKDDRFDVIVCDLMMPGVDGVAVFEHVGRAYPQLASRFVFCSGGLVTSRAREHAARPGTRLLYKPASIDDMLRAISTVMDDHRGEVRPSARP